MMRKHIALLLVLAMMLWIVPGVSAADAAEAQIVLNAGFTGTNVQVTVRLENAAHVTNGRLILQYAPEAESLLEVHAASGLGAVSVNKETSGEVAFAWVGSEFTEEGAELFTAVFAPVAEEDLHFAARASELFAKGEAVSAKDAKVFVSWNPFTDISGHWAEEQIVEGWHRGLVRGMTDTTFQPEGLMSRGMFVTILHRMAGCPEAKLPSEFTDVASGRYYEEAVNWAVELGVTEGTGDGRFLPHKAIDRQEMVTMLYRYAKAMNQNVEAEDVLDRFEDGEKVADWAVDAMNWAISNEIVNGMTETRLVPQGHSTRAQAITILCRFLEA